MVLFLWCRVLGPQSHRNCRPFLLNKSSLGRCGATAIGILGSALEQNALSSLELLAHLSVVNLKLA